jgi:hypothetical protein
VSKRKRERERKIDNSPPCPCTMSVLSKAAIEPFSVYKSSIPRSTAMGDFGLGKWKEYFREPPFKYKPNVYKDLTHNINDLPKAYFGHNVFLAHAHPVL